MKTVTALELRKKLGSVLTSVAEKHEPVTITRANKPLAVLISAEDYQEKMLKSDRGRKRKELSAKMDAWKKEHRKETMHIDVVKAVREARDRRCSSWTPQWSSNGYSMTRSALNRRPA
jgi:prevent-host-death family protein